ncbi:LOW QUALITY PROTEIN: non-ribosomal peptide synthetase [Colletotrichum tofieldiae]|nr:LOW QUALITY PROTEIN: non-ribosomal peptide synthetase [Colletotrichum tofieldiae]
MAEENFGFAVKGIDGITPSTIFRTAWALLTRSYTGDSDVVFGMTVNGRNAPVPGIEHMSGPTIATVPTRIRWDSRGDTTLRTLLETVQMDATAMIPFEQTGLQHISRINEDAQAACQFGTLFVVQQDDGEEYEALTSIMQLYDATENRSTEFTTQPLRMYYGCFEQVCLHQIEL